MENVSFLGSQFFALLVFDKIKIPNSNPEHPIGEYLLVQIKRHVKISLCDCKNFEGLCNPQSIYKYYTETIGNYFTTFSVLPNVMFT